MKPLTISCPPGAVMAASSLAVRINMAPVRLAKTRSAAVHGVVNTSAVRKVTVVGSVFSAALRSAAMTASSSMSRPVAARAPASTAAIANTPDPVPRSRAERPRTSRALSSRRHRRVV